MKKMGKLYGEVDKNREQLMVDSYKDIVDGSTCKPSTRKPATSPPLRCFCWRARCCCLRLRSSPSPRWQQRQ